MFLRIELFVILAFASRVILAQGGSNIAAAAAQGPTFDDCDCQCVSLQYYDSYGNVHGNCDSSFNGGRWCYVELDRFSPCIDNRASQRFPGKYWSYHACTTPPRYSNQCQDLRPLPYATRPVDVRSVRVADGVNK